MINAAMGDILPRKTGSLVDWVGWVGWLGGVKSFFGHGLCGFVANRCLLAKKGLETPEEMGIILHCVERQRLFRYIGLIIKMISIRS